MTRIVNAYALTTVSVRVGDQLAAAYSCDNCRWPSAAIGGTVAAHPHAASQAMSEASQMNAAHAAADVYRWFPEAAVGKDFPDVPEHIASVADEAHRCRSFDALRASVLMCRSVIEATAKDKGITTGSLVAKIDSMEKKGFIRPHIKDAAHEIRHLGNDMAHGDFVEEVEPEEADEILELMGEVLAEVFQSPARIARRQSARQAKTANP